MLPNKIDRGGRPADKLDPMPRTNIAASSAIGLIALWAAVASPAVAEETEASLGGYPLCEASAALVVECPDPDSDRCLLVGDNEITDRLFLFTFDADAPAPLAERREVPMLADDSETVSDIEAVVALNSGEVLIYGSHSRNKECDPKKKRRRMFLGRLGAESFEVVDVTRSKKPTCKRLFGVSTEDAQGNMKRLCETMVPAEEAADKVDGKLENEELDERAAEAQCNKIHDFNLEGAVAIKDGDQETIWVGLRAPLVGDDEHAVLLRQKSKKKFEFDAVVLLDLGGAGIRELAAVGEYVWVIAGPPNDSKAKHSLRRFPLSALAAGNVASGDALIEPVESSIELPTSAEGLVVLGDKAIVMMDGDEPESKSVLSCRKDSTYKVFSLSDF